MRLGTHSMASVPDRAADWGSAGGSTRAAGCKPPGLRRCKAGHPPTSVNLGPRLSRVPIRLWWIQAVTKPPFIKASCNKGHWI